MRYSTYRYLRTADPVVMRHRRLRRASTISFLVVLTALVFAGTTGLLG